MSKVVLPGSTRHLTFPATILHRWPELQLAIRSPGIRRLPCLHRPRRSPATHKSCLGWARRNGARMAAPRENASAAAHLEESLCPLKLEDYDTPPSHWDDAAPPGGETLGKVVVKLEDESPQSVVGKSELDVRKLSPSRVVGELEAEAHKNVGKVADKSESEAPKKLEKLVVSEVDVGKLDAAAAQNSDGTRRQAPMPAKAGQPDAELAGASGQGPALIYIAEKSPQHMQGLLENKELNLPAGARLVGAVEQGGSIDNQDFDGDAYFAELSTSQFGKLYLFSSRLPSTHTILSQNWSAFPRGTVCLADVQYQGKGRGGNVWESPKGCLMFSYTLQLKDGRTLPFLQYVVSLAVVEGIEAYCLKQGLVKPDVRIKWPNDLYAKGLKVGGVLCTSSYSAGKFNLVVGVGLNVSNRLPTTCLEALLEELNPSSHAVKREILLATIVNQFEPLLSTFVSQGFSPLEASYCRRWLHSGQKVELEERAEDGSNSISIVPVTVQGLTPSGYLLATDENGEQYELHPDGNSFDFLKGLVRRKLVSKGN